MAFATCRTSPPCRKEWLALGLLVGAALLLHGHGLTFGFFLDDNNHLELCSKNGYAGLASGNSFDWNRNIVRVWWAAKETGWAYFRPVPVALRVTWLRLFGLEPLAFHAIHLGLYLAVVLLFYGLLRRCGLGTWIALLGGLFFTMHPTHAQVALWLAGDTLILAGLGYVSALWFMLASASAGHRRPALIAGACGCYALALLSREAGLMLGPILVLFDWLYAGRSLERRPWRLYIALALEGVLYLGVRTLLLPSAPLPRSPYFHWPTETGFASWLPYKLLTDTFCLTLGFPFVPIAEVPWLKARPLATALAVASVLGVIVVFLVPLRRSRVLWGILGGMVLAAAPTVLTFSAAYMYFLVSAGWAAVLALWTAWQWPRRPRLVIGCLATLTVLYLGGLWASVWQIRAGAWAEWCVREEVLATDPAAYPPGTKLFFVNMPLLATEVGPSLRLKTARNDLEVFPLTYAPGPFATRQCAKILQEDERTLLVCMDGDGWFPGIFGEDLQLGWFGASRDMLPTGAVTMHAVAGEMPFRVEVVETGPDSIRAMRFVFDKPLGDPSYRFFIGNTLCPAQPWQPNGNPLQPVQDPRLVVYNGRMQRMQKAAEQVCRVLCCCP